jgi:hypothetical protein
VVLNAPPLPSQPRPSAPGVLARVSALAREILLPIAVVVALLLIAVALIEGPPLEQFLYAVF